jgi:hypothetical protein
MFAYSLVLVLVTWSISKPKAHANKQRKVSRTVEKLEFISNNAAKEAGERQCSKIGRFLSEWERNYNPLARGVGEEFQFLGKRGAKTRNS